MHLCGHRFPYPNRHEYWHEHPNPDLGLFHTVCYSGEYVVDLTYRQFNIHASLAYDIQTRTMFEANWLMCAPEHIYMDSCFSIINLLHTIDHSNKQDDRHTAIVKLHKYYN